MKLIWCSKKGCRMVKLGDNPWHMNADMILQVLAGERNFEFKRCPHHEKHKETKAKELVK